MKYYELIYLISPELSKEELESFSKKVSGFIAEEGGKPYKAIHPSKRKLAYPIKKEIEGFLISLTFYLPPGNLVGLEKKLKAEGQILRSIILNKTAPQKPSKLPEKKIEPKEPLAPQPKAEKVELKEIDKKIEEILKD